MIFLADTVDSDDNDGWRDDNDDDNNNGAITSLCLVLAIFGHRVK